MSILLERAPQLGKPGDKHPPPVAVGARTGQGALGSVWSLWSGSGGERSTLNPPQALDGRLWLHPISNYLYYCSLTRLHFANVHPTE